MNDYKAFLESKRLTFNPCGIVPTEPHKTLFQFQRDIVKWALKKGRACIFADCGMGKTFMQLEWAAQIDGKVLILAPLAVCQQTITEGKRLGVDVVYSPDGSLTEQITITNYERLHHFSFDELAGLVLDESSIIKHFTGATCKQILDNAKTVPYRLACTATPAPNDHMELGNHAEFVGAMSRTEMLSMFFVHDGGNTSEWRLKGHAESEFWKWVCSWAVMIRRPSDLGYDNGAFILPKLNIEQITVEHGVKGTFLFPLEAVTLQERLSARRDSIDDRVAKVAEMVNASDEPWIVWCNLNNESDGCEDAIPDSVNVAGADDAELKCRKMQDFKDGKVRVMISKPSVAGWGVNWQHCRNVVFVGLSDSWESYYQSVRRSYRFGQKKQVNVYIVTSSAEGAVVRNIERKEMEANIMAESMVKHMADISAQEIKGTSAFKTEYKRQEKSGESWRMMLGDCVECVSELADESVGFSVFSPPFASLYTYSASDRDMGNSKDMTEFQTHFQFLIGQLFRVLQSGRLVSFHCMNLPTSKTRHGYIGIEDFRGDLIRMFEKEGFIFHSEVCIWKDPVTSMQRTKALGLLHKQIVKDSCMSRQGIPDYMVTMRKPGVNVNPVDGELDRWIGDGSFKSEGRLSIDLWQRYASPVWMDIDPSNTLQKESAREDKDERHICPLQLDVIDRALELWSNPGDVVLSPFGGIGSEGHVALLGKRKFIGVELKESYYRQACLNLAKAELKSKEALLL